MKKMLSMILVLCLLLCAAGCAKPAGEQAPVEYKTEIIGQWQSPAINAAATFNEDGTGELNLNGAVAATWSYDPATNTYIVVADTTYTVTAGKEYDMPYISVNGIDMYQFDDYDNAYILMLSKRLEDIDRLKENAIKVTTEDVYTLTNGVTIHFTGIDFVEMDECDGINIAYIITNDNTTPVTSDLTLTLDAKYYMVDKQAAFTGFASVPLASAIAAESGINDSFIFSLDRKVAETVARDGQLIGAVFFEMYGQRYFIDLSFMGK